MGGNWRTMGIEIEAFKKVISLVFKYFLASLPQFSGNYLCFQILLSFVPTVAFYGAIV
jgi:hypothetical protein